MTLRPVYHALGSDPPEVTGASGSERNGEDIVIGTIAKVSITAVIAGGVIAAGSIVPAAAKQARCYNSDDGWYSCEFRQHGGDGSFTVSAPGVPSYTLAMIEPGVADGFANYGDGNLFLPGPFHRAQDDRACWIANATGFKICAY